MNVNVPIEELRRLAAETEESTMNPDTAQVIRGLRFTAAERARADELAERLEDEEGLTAPEADEARHLSELSDLLALLKLRAEPAAKRDGSGAAA